MSEVERRRSYHYNRILIETARILSPTFDDAVVYLTGAQLELLRNITQYLNRQETYVDEYNPGYYLMADTEDYDSILEIVADMEEALMGNPNTIWGYNDIVADAKSRTKSGDGTFQEWSDVVPEGVVWVLQHVGIVNTTAARGAARIELSSVAEGAIWLLYDPSPGVVEHVYRGPVVLETGDRIKWIQYTCLNGDQHELSLSGYSMVVPS